MQQHVVKQMSEVDALRSRMDADARFHRVLSGYDPDEVRAYTEEIRRVLTRQSSAAKEQQESLILQMDSIKSELQARNCAIRSLKETLAHREALLESANTRIAKLIQSVQRAEAERLESPSAQETASDRQPAEKHMQELEQETQQLRATLAKAANVIGSWKIERTQLTEENARLRQETEYLKGLFRELTQDAKERIQPPAAQVQAVSLTPQQAEAVHAVSTKLADTFADAFAEAYDLVDKFRTSSGIRKIAPVRPAQPRMHLLRPNGTSTEF